MHHAGSGCRPGFCQLLICQIVLTHMSPSVSPLWVCRACHLRQTLGMWWQSQTLYTEVTTLQPFLRMSQLQSMLKIMLETTFCPQSQCLGYVRAMSLGLHHVVHARPGADVALMCSEVG